VLSRTKLALGCSNDHPLWNLYQPSRWCVQPFAEEGLFLLDLFPPVERLVSATALAGALAASLLVGYIGCILVHSQLVRHASS